MRKILGTVAAIAAISMSVGAQAAPIDIDLFTTGQGPLTDTSVDATAVSSSIIGADIIGGERDMSSNLTALNAPGNVSSEVGGGKYAFSITNGEQGVGVLQWDGADNSMGVNYTGLGGVDLTDLFTNTAIELIVNGSDGFFTFAIQIWTDASNWSILTLLANEQAYIDPGVAHYIPLAAFSSCGFGNPGDPIFVTCGGTGADLTNVGAIQATISSLDNGGLDLTLDQVRVVPEPGSLALAGLGLLGLGALRRRNGKQA